MERLRELLLKWDEGIISRDETEELKTLLQNPEQRREMVDEFFLTGEISEFLKEEKSIPEKSKFSEEVSVTSSGRILRKQRKSGKWKPGIIWASVAACLIIAAGAFLYNLYEMGRTDELINAKLIEIKGGITIERDGNKIPAPENAELYSGDRIEAGKGARVNVKYNNEQTVISISGETRAEFRQEKGAKKIKLDTGSINCSVAPQPENKEVLIYTPHAELKILGTEFTLAVTKEKGTFLGVAEGSVLLTDTSTGESAEVTGGCTASVNEKETKPAARGTPGKVIRTVTLDNSYMGVTFDGTVLWMSKGNRRKELYKIDPETGKRIGSLKTKVGCQGIDWDGTYIWTVDGLKVHAIDINTGKTVKTFNAPRDKNGNAPCGVTAGNGILWVVSSSTIFLLDKEDGEVLGSINGQTSTNVQGLTYLRNSIWTRAYKADYNPKTREWIKTYGLCKLDPATGRQLLFIDTPGTWKEGWGAGFSNAGDANIWMINSLEKKAYLIETGMESIDELKKRSGSSSLISLPRHIDRDEFWTTRAGFAKSGIIAHENFKDNTAFRKAWDFLTVDSSTNLLLDQKIPEENIGITESEIDNIKKSVLKMDTKEIRNKEYKILRKFPKNIPAFSANGRILCKKPYIDPGEKAEGKITLAGVQTPKDEKSHTLYIFKNQNNFFTGKIGKWFSYSAEAMKMKDGAGRTFIDMRLFINNQLFSWTRVHTNMKKWDLNLCYSIRIASILLDEIVIYKLTQLKKKLSKPKDVKNPNTTYQSRTHSVFK